MRLFLLCISAFALLLPGCGKNRSTERGAVIYAENCAICHGGDARGGGGANVAGLSKTPPDLTVLSRQAGGVFPKDAVIVALLGYAAGSHAGRRMQPFDDLGEGRIKRVRTKDGRVRVPSAQAALLDYLETVQR